MRSLRSLACLSLLFFPITPTLISSCGGQTTPETIVAEISAQAEAAFENHSTRELQKLISADYQDSSGRNFKDIMATGSAYMLRAKSIHLFVDQESAIFVDDLIEARVLAAFVARPVTDRKMLLQLEADIYWFDIVLADKDNGWKLISASWQQAVLDDFFDKNSKE